MRFRKSSSLSLGFFQSSSWFRSVRVFFLLLHVVSHSCVFVLCFMELAERNAYQFRMIFLLMLLCLEPLKFFVKNVGNVTIRVNQFLTINHQILNVFIFRNMTKAILMMRWLWLLFVSDLNLMDLFVGISVLLPKTIIASFFLHILYLAVCFLAPFLADSAYSWRWSCFSLPSLSLSLVRICIFPFSSFHLRSFSDSRHSRTSGGYFGWFGQFVGWHYCFCLCRDGFRSNSTSLRPSRKGQPHPR